MSGLKIEYPGLAESLHASVREHIKTLERSVRSAELVTAKLSRTTPMAEEQAIPEAVMREARTVARRITVLHGADITRSAHQIALAILAAELRGRTEQIEADARIAEDVTRKHCAGSHFVMTGPAGIGRSIATAIRSQS